MNSRLEFDLASLYNQMSNCIDGVECVGSRDSFHRSVCWFFTIFNNAVLSGRNRVEPVLFAAQERIVSRRECKFHDSRNEYRSYNCSADIHLSPAPNTSLSISLDNVLAVISVFMWNAPLSTNSIEWITRSKQIARIYTRKLLIIPEHLVRQLHGSLSLKHLKTREKVRNVFLWLKN